MNQSEIQMTQPDFDRLEHLVNGWWATDVKTRELLELLQHELDRARIVASEDVDPDRITLGSEIALRDLDSGDVAVFRLAWPSHAVPGESIALSILSPMGISALGYREGDEFEVEAPGGKRRMRVEEVRYQPERSLQAAQRAAPPQEQGRATLARGPAAGGRPSAAFLLRKEPRKPSRA